MIRLKGVFVQGGLSIGPIHYLHRASKPTKHPSSLSPREELLRFEAAKDRAFTDLKRMQARIGAHLGSDEAAIFLFQSMMLEDPDYLQAIYDHINDSATAEYAIDQAGKTIIDFFASLDNSYLRSRALDARDLSHRLAGILSQRADIGRLRQTPAILVAEDLTPSETILLDTGMLLGLVSQNGAPDSHTSILAQSIGVPAITGIVVDPRWEGRLAILDGDKAEFIIDPDEATLAAAHPHQSPGYDPSAVSELTLPHADTSQRPLRLCAMIDSAWEAIDAYKLGASGIAPYQPGVLHSGRATPPSEDEQMLEYRRTVDAMRGRPVAILSLDVGGIGLGSLFSATRQERYHQLKAQFRAVLRAAVGGTCAIVLSGVKTKSDIRRCRQILEQCKRELRAENLEYRAVRIGVEIAVPFAAFIIDELAEGMDLIIVNGESLMRSTISSQLVGALPNYRALAWMLRQIIDAGHRHGCLVIMSGDLESFPQAIQPLLSLGVDVLSVPVRSLLPLFERLSEASNPSQSKNRGE
ncbi:MAG: phosphoenolpyruvate--protein phosphotransferase [Oscillospiraceae bacterium]|nr:phosphoenolpyruvate--protein phosphotransferase [Oscillospiraceae bacterium]